MAVWKTTIRRSGCDLGLENILDRIEQRRNQFGQIPENMKEGLNQCEQARDMLVQRFLEAIATVGTSASIDILNADGASNRLKLMTSDLQAELEIQSIVAKQMQELIRAKN